MKSLLYEQYKWVKLNRRMVKNKLKQESATSTVFCYGAKPCALHFPPLPDKEIMALNSMPSFSSITL